MLEKLRQFLTEFSAGDAGRSFGEADYRLAATALLIHVISTDGEPSEVEKRKLHSLLEYRFELAPGSADTLIAEATRMENDAVDLYHFTSQITRATNDATRARIIEMMWELVYADDHASEFEENVVWRAADLLGISSQERIALRQRVTSTRLVTGLAHDDAT